ncbi:MAG: deoxyribonuclease IV [Lachnospiraceae bacterium]
MFIIGCHLSSSKGYLAMGKQAVAIGATTFQFFTRNPRGGTAKPLNIEDMQAYTQFAAEHGLRSILAHAPYTLNSCSKDSRLREFAAETMQDDLARLEYLPGTCYNFHPGSHVQQGAQTGIRYCIEMLNRVLKPEQSTTVLLETMSGKGSEIGRTFGELRAILDGVALRQHMGICLDTCHVFDGGYDIVENLEAVLAEFDDCIGLEHLKAVHLNDSKNTLGSHKDRHAKIGEGHIGTDAFSQIINHPKLCHLPFYLETPNDLDGYAAEILMLQKLYKSPL